MDLEPGEGEDGGKTTKWLGKMIHGGGRGKNGGKGGAGGHGDGLLLHNRSQEKLSSDQYQWPYQDSYAPGVPMKHTDVKVVHKSIQKQYQPNPGDSRYTLKQLQERNNAIRDI